MDSGFILGGFLVWFVHPGGSWGTLLGHVEPLWAHLEHTRMYIDFWKQFKQKGDPGEITDNVTDPHPLPRQSHPGTHPHCRAELKLSSASLSKYSFNSHAGSADFANLNFANLNFADLNCVNVNVANRYFANLNFANLNFANWNFANLNISNFNFTNFRVSRRSL